MKTKQPTTPLYILYYRNRPADPWRALISADDMEMIQFYKTMDHNMNTYRTYKIEKY